MSASVQNICPDCHETTSGDCGKHKWNFTYQFSWPQDKQQEMIQLLREIRDLLRRRDLRERDLPRERDAR